MSARQYLDNTVVPILLQAMTELAKVRYPPIHTDPASPSSSSQSILSSTIPISRQNEQIILKYLVITSLSTLSYYTID